MMTPAKKCSVLVLVLFLTLALKPQEQDPISALEKHHQKILEKVKPSLVSISIVEFTDEEWDKLGAKKEEQKKLYQLLREKHKNKEGQNLLKDLLEEDIFSRILMSDAKNTFTGFIASSDGDILTTRFNVQSFIPEGQKLMVRLHNGTIHKAKLVGISESRSFALLKIDAKDLPTLPKAKLKELKVGQIVLALAMGPDGKTPTLNPGIISAVKRMGGLFLQVDARLNYGNAGGALVDLEGDWIGIPCKISTDTSKWLGQNSGVGFVLPWDRIGETLPQLKKGMPKVSAKLALLGITLTEEEKEVAKIDHIEKNSAAEKAGLKEGDVIVGLDGKKISSSSELQETFEAKKLGEKVKLKVKRDSEKINVEMVLGEPQ